MLGEVETAIRRKEPAFWVKIRGSADPRMPRNGITAGRSEPGNRAHTFRMTLVAQGKLPQINSFVGRFGSFKTWQLVCCFVSKDHDGKCHFKCDQYPAGQKMVKKDKKWSDQDVGKAIRGLPGAKSIAEGPGTSWECLGGLKPQEKN